MEPPSAPAGPRAGIDMRSPLVITVLAGGQGVRIAGDVDTSVRDRLRSALASLPGSGPALHVDLADLRFIDVAGARELMALASSRPSRRLILHDPPRTMRRLLALLWPGAAVEIRDSVPPRPAIEIRHSVRPAAWRPGVGSPAARSRAPGGMAN